LNSSSQFDASASLAGYLYQCRLALLLALRELKRKPNCQISIEKFDDIAFHDEDYISTLENCETYVGLEILGRIADVLGVEGAELLQKPPPKRPSKRR
jgi:hypothetical protein